MLTVAIASKIFLHGFAMQKYAWVEERLRHIEEVFTLQLGTGACPLNVNSNMYSPMPLGA